MVSGRCEILYSYTACCVMKEIISSLTVYCLTICAPYACIIPLPCWSRLISDVNTCIMHDKKAHLQRKLKGPFLILSLRLRFRRSPDETFHKPSLHENLKYLAEYREVEMAMFGARTDAAALRTSHQHSFAIFWTLLPLQNFIAVLSIAVHFR